MHLNISNIYDVKFILSQIYRLEHEDQPQVIEIPELAPYPELAQILRNCTIPRRDLRIKSCTALLSHLRRWAADHPDISEGMFDR